MRPDGFSIADHDVGFLSDDRVLDAVELAGPRAIVGYLAVRDLSWARGERVTYGSAVRRLSPLYGLEPFAPDPVLEALVSTGLLDADGRIPEASWEVWYSPARARLVQRRDAGRRGGLAKAANRAASDATPSLQRPPNGQAPRTGRSTARRASDATASLAQSPSDAVANALPDRPTDDLPNGRSVVRDAREPRPPDPTEVEVADDPYVGRVVEPVDQVATVYCHYYRDHQSEHYRPAAGVGFVCRICGPRPAPSFRDAIAANGGPQW